MKISGTGSFNYADKNNTQSYSIDNQIRKLEELKRKIEEDLTKKSTNPDPLAAIGDNNANSSVNRKILESIETRIRNLENRKNSATNSDNDLSTKATEKNWPQYPSRHIDTLA